jgi:hypothetical protein
MIGFFLAAFRVCFLARRRGPTRLVMRSSMHMPYPSRPGIVTLPAQSLLQTLEV